MPQDINEVRQLARSTSGIVCRNQPTNNPNGVTWGSAIDKRPSRNIMRRCRQGMAIRCAPVSRPPASCLTTNHLLTDKQEARVQGGRGGTKSNWTQHTIGASRPAVGLTMAERDRQPPSILCSWLSILRGGKKHPCSLLRVYHPSDQINVRHVNFQRPPSVCPECSRL